MECKECKEFMECKNVCPTDVEIFSAGVVGLRIIYANEIRKARRVGDPRI